MENRQAWIFTESRDSLLFLWETIQSCHQNPFIPLVDSILVVLWGTIPFLTRSF